MKIEEFLFEAGVDPKDEVPSSGTHAYDSYEVIQDVPYLEDGARNPYHQLDVYVPRKSKQQQQEQLFKVIFFAHSGGWQRGDKKSAFYGAPSFSKNLALRGYLVVNANYSLAGLGSSVKFPEIIGDIAAAVAWTRKNIQAFANGDPDNIL